MDLGKIKENLARNKVNAEEINLTRREIVEQLRILLEPWLQESDMAEQINEQTNLLTDLGIDSVGILQLVLGVEKEFTVTINDHELDSDVFSRVGNLIDIIEGKINENN